MGDLGVDIFAILISSSPFALLSHCKLYCSGTHYTVVHPLFVFVGYFLGWWADTVTIYCPSRPPQLSQKNNKTLWTSGRTAMYNCTVNYYHDIQQQHLGQLGLLASNRYEMSMSGGVAYGSGTCRPRTETRHDQRNERLICKHPNRSSTQTSVFPSMREKKDRSPLSPLDVYLKSINYACRGAG